MTVVSQGYWGMVGSGAQPGLADIFAGLGINGFNPATGIAAVHRILSAADCRRSCRSAPGAGPWRPWATTRPWTARSSAAAIRPPWPPLAGHLGAGTAAGTAARRVLTGYEGAGGRLRAHAARRLPAHGSLPALRRTARRRGTARPPRDPRPLPAAARGTAQHPGRRRIPDPRRRPGRHHPGGRRIDADEHSGRWGGGGVRPDRGGPTRHPSRRSPSTGLFLQRAYPRILRGEVGATESMFSGSWMKLVQNFYRGNPLTDSLQPPGPGHGPPLPGPAPAAVAAGPHDRGRGAGRRHRRHQRTGAARAGRLHSGTRRTTPSPTSRRVSWNARPGALRRTLRLPPASRCSTSNAVWRSRGSSRPVPTSSSPPTSCTPPATYAPTLRRAKALLRPGGWLVPQRTHLRTAAADHRRRCPGGLVGLRGRPPAHGRLPARLAAGLDPAPARGGIRPGPRAGRRRPGAGARPSWWRRATGSC
ncbi:hypothetical protein LV779_39230 [Streptomyces thinghirensis]|nr:hypothetical protein [Streptomyces thinghirensis]